MEIFTYTETIVVFPILILIALSSRCNMSFGLVSLHCPILWVNHPSIRVFGPVKWGDFLVLIAHVWKKGARRVGMMRWISERLDSLILVVRETIRSRQLLTILLWSFLITVIFRGKGRVAAAKLPWYMSPEMIYIFNDFRVCCFT